MDGPTVPSPSPPPPSDRPEDDSPEQLQPPMRRAGRAKEATPIRREGSLTMSSNKKKKAGEEDSSDEDEEQEEEEAGKLPSDVAEAGTRPPSERLRKIRFPRRPPRIDAQMAQVQVPVGPFDRNLRPPSPTHPEVRVVWTGEMSEEILSYLAFCRRLLGKSSVPVTEPLEEDEQALEFLQEHGGNDVERAKLMLLSSVGGGAEIASITLEQLHESKVRPRGKGLSRAWVGGEFRTEVEHPDANNPTKVRQLWKDWASRCKKAMSNSQITAVELVALQKEERQLPRFQSRGTPEDDVVVSAANEQAADLDARLRDVELYTAEIHDALSLVHPERRFTAADLKRLADEAPRKMQIKEVEILKNLVSKSEAWEKRAARWIQDDDTAESNAATASSSSSNGNGTGGGIQRKKSGPVATGAGTSASQEFTLASLNELIREGKQSSIDHSATLRTLVQKRTECETLMKRLALHVPQDKSWKQNRKKYEILSLSKLKQLRDEMRKSRLRFHQAHMLESHIAQAEDWVEAARRSSTSERCTVKELQSLLSKADQIPVNLSEEKKILEQFLSRALDWIRRAKGFFPPTNSTAVVTGPTKKTRANIAAFESGDGGFQKGTSDAFLALRDEARDIGLESLSEAAMALEVAETVEDWIARVNEAMKDITDDKLDLLHELLQEAESLPVIVNEEKELRSVTAKRTWSREAAILLKKPIGTVPLREMEAHLVEADRLFPAEHGRKKKVKRSTLLEHEAELRLLVEEARNWIDRANQILQATQYSEKFETYEQVKELLTEQVQADVSSIRKQLIKHVRSIADWQMTVRKALLGTGVVDPAVFKGKQDTCDVILTPQVMSLLSGDDTQSDDEGAGDDKATGDDAKMDVEDTEAAKQKKIPVLQFRAMLQEAQKIGFVIPELDVLTELDNKVKNWQTRFAVILLDPSSSSSSAVLASASKSKKKRPRSDQDATLPSPARLALEESDLETLAKDAQELPVDCSEHLADLRACLEATVEWRELCSGPLERYRQACREYMEHPESYTATGQKQAVVGCFSRFAEALQNKQEMPPIDESAILDELCLVVKDPVTKQEKFPVDHEVDSPWWLDEYPESIKQAMQEVVAAMQEAESRKLHLVGLDSAPVRACSWLIQADNWLDDLRKEFLLAGDSSSSSPLTKSLWSLCQAVLNGLHLLVSAGRDEDDDPLPEDFPDSALNDYKAPENLVLPAGITLSTVTTLNGPSSSKRSRKSAPTNDSISATTAAVTSSSSTTSISAAVVSPVGESNTSSSTVPPPSSAVEEQQEESAAPLSIVADESWRILKYTRTSTSEESEGFTPSPTMGVPSVSGTILKRLFGLERIAQSAFASRGQAKRMGRVPRPDRTQARLKQYIAASVSWSKAVTVEEDPRFAYELSLSEAWVDEKKKTMHSKKSTVDQLEKLANRGDKVWVDLSQIDYVRNQARLAKEWLLAVKKSGMDEGTVTSVDHLKDLLKKGEKLHGVDVSFQLEQLKKATQIFCMCAGPREGHMMQCVECNDVFHPKCIGTFYHNLCPICNVGRAVQRLMGLANAAGCRVLALEAVINDPVFAQQAQLNQVMVQDLASARLVVDWMRQVRPLLEPDRVESADSTTLAQEFPLRPEAVQNCLELKFVFDAISARRWRMKLETLRRRPALGELEATLKVAPPALADSLRGLEHLVDRGRRAIQLYEEIWNSPVTTPAADIVQRCQELSVLVDHLPLEGVTRIARAADACIEDEANRHCLCNKFDNGTKMVSCGKCSRWFHDDCLKTTGNPKYMGDLDSDEDFFCPDCLADEPPQLL